MRRAWLWAVAVLAVAGVLACGTAALPCSSATCDGCCSPDAVCVKNAGQTNSRCGINAEMCKTCGGSQTCSSGVCVGGSTDGGP